MPEEQTTEALPYAVFTIEMRVEGEYNDEDVVALEELAEDFEDALDTVCRHVKLPVKGVKFIRKST